MKKILAIVLALVMLLALAACGSGDTTPADTSKPADNKPADNKPADSGETYKIVCSSGYAPDHYMSLCYYAFEEELEAATNGQIQVEVFTDGSLTATDLADIEGIASKTVTMADADFTMYGSAINSKEWQSTSIPYFLPSDVDDLYSVLDNCDAWLGLYDQLESTLGIKIVGSVSGGSVSVANATRSIDSLEAFEGLKIRTPESDPYTKPISAWNGNPTPMSFSEVYSSIQQGTIDGVMSSTSAINSYGLYEICKYHTEFGVFNLIFGFGMDAEFYNSLPADLQAKVDAACETMVAVAREGEVEYRNGLGGIMADLGVTVVNPEGEFQAALEAAVADHVNSCKAALDPEFRAAVEAAVDAVK